MGSTEAKPSVSIIIPTYNEERRLDDCLRSVARQTYPRELMEVLVIDGRSEDGTRALAEAWRARLLLDILDNPRRLQAAALNIGLRRAANDLIVRLDAHSTYADDYVERSVGVLLGSDAVMVGGPMRPRGETEFGEGVAVATTTRFGVGPGRVHYSERVEYVDTVYLGTFRRRDVLAVGGYSEDVLANEDDELSFRITASGGRILLDPSIRSTYLPRSSPAALWRQYHRYGRGKARMLLKHGRLPTWRPLAPAGLVAWAALTPLLAARSRRWRGQVALSWAAYVAVVAAVGAVRGRSRRLASRTAGAIWIMHLAYGLGLWRDLLSGILLVRDTGPPGRPLP